MFTIPNEGELPGFSRVQIRFSEALYFFEQFKRHCGSSENPQDSSFHWIAYSDAFLMALLSIQDLVGPKRKRRLLMGYESLKKEGKPIPADYTPNPLLVLKLMRNRTVHHCVFSAPSDGREKGSVSRVINVRVGGADAGKWSEPRVPLSQMRAVLSRLKAKYARDKKKGKSTPKPKVDIKETRLYIKRLRGLGKEDIHLHSIFREGLERVASICGLPQPCP
jgi:hypothetical protein